MMLDEKAHDQCGGTPLEIAIIGGGVVGICAAGAFHARNISVTVYEQASEIKDIGVGIGFLRNIVECMGALDPQIVEQLEKISFPIRDMQWVDGTHKEDIRLRDIDKLPDMVLSEPALELSVCRRSEFIDRMLSLLPEDCLKLKKRLVNLEQNETGKMVMKFKDGSEAEADAVIGCDGVKSTVRRLVVGEDDPSAVAHFAKESAYRCLIPMENVKEIMGPYAYGMFWWTGPDVSLVSYPIAQNKYLNVGAFVKQDNWPAGNTHTIKGSKNELIEAFAGYGPLIRGLVQTFPEELTRWGMFDTLEHPLRSYAHGQVALMGDAAHASTPHHGAGAGMGMEDALVMAAVLDLAAQVVMAGTASKRKVLAEAFKAYDKARRERSQWVVTSSRRQGALGKWDIPEIGRDLEKIRKDTRSRINLLGNFNWKKMVDGAIEDFKQRLQEAGILEQGSL